MTFLGVGLANETDGPKLGGLSLQEEELAKILTDKGLAQFGDSLLNFSYSIAGTRKAGKPEGLQGGRQES